MVESSSEEESSEEEGLDYNDTSIQTFTLGGKNMDIKQWFKEYLAKYTVKQRQPLKD